MRTSWRAALRIARRDALRARGRSALIVAMVALPVLALTAAITMLEIYDLSPKEEATRQLGAADAAYSSSGHAGPVIQRPGSPGYRTPHDTSPTKSSEAWTRPRSVIPDGSRVITKRTLSARVSANDELYRAQFTELDYADPIADGIVRERAGRAPQHRDEVAVTTALRESLKLDLGDTLRISKSYGSERARSHTFTVVGTVVDPEDLGKLGVVGLPGALTGHAGDASKAERAEKEALQATTWLATTPQPVTWEQVHAANQQGVLVDSRSVMLDPPPPSAVPGSSRDRGGPDVMTFAIGALVVAMAILEVVLLAGAAFAVGTRRQSRQLALIAAGGGEPRHVRSIVLAGGVVLGVTGAVAGVVLGAAGGAATSQILAWLSVTSLPGRFGVPPLQAAGLGLLGAVTGVLAALVPARGAARQDIIAALTGRRGTVRTKRRYPIIGLVLCGIGAALAGGGAAAGASQDPSYGRFAAIGIAGGAIISQLGLVFAAPAIIGFASRFGRFLPATSRIALRDSARNRSRAAPAMAAVMAAVAGASALSLYVVSGIDSDRRAYTPSAQMGQATVPFEGRDMAKRAAIREAVSAQLPVTRATLLRTATADSCDRQYCPPVNFRRAPSYRCPRPDPESRAAQRQAGSREPHCRSSELVSRGVIVGKAPALHALTGQSESEASQAVARGKAVVFDRRLISGGQAYLNITRDAQTGGRAHSTTVTVPAVYVEEEIRGPGGFLSPQTARRLGLAVHPSRLLFSTSRMPTEEEVAKASAALEDHGLLTNIDVERGFESNRSLVLLVLIAASAVITLGSSGIATGLALADGRADQTTLGAVGASPRIRRLLAASQAGTISWLGSGLGILAGLVPGIAVVWAQQQMRIVIPWASLALILVAVPTLAMLAALLFTRSRLALARRID